MLYCVSFSLLLVVLCVTNGSVASLQKLKYFAPFLYLRGTTQNASPLIPECLHV